MSTKCELTVPFTTIDPDLPLHLKKVNGIMRGTMCIKSILTVPHSTMDPDLSMNMKKS